MKIVCISDTHTFGRNLIVPDGDVLVHTGDHTFRGTEIEVKAALAWLESLPHKHKVLVSGNHDFYFDERFTDGHCFRGWVIERSQSVAELLSNYPSLTYLQDSGCEIDGVKFYGSPWQPWYYDWAFNFDPFPGGIEQAKATWAKIPDDVQVLLTHTPPRGILDSAYDHDKLGDHYLRARIEDLPNLRLHAFGHIHESYGIEEYEADGPEGSSRITFVNAASCNIEYDPNRLNPPIVVDL